MSTTDPQRIIALLQAFINARTWLDSMRAVQTYPELLADEVDVVLTQMLEAAAAQKDEDARQVFDEHRALLRHCREAGVQAAFAVKMGLPPGTDPLEAEAAETQARASPDLGEMPQEVGSILQELARPARRADMPRRVELCRQALHFVERGQDPSLWAALQNILASSLVQTPLGDQAENIELAIHHLTQALEVRTRQAVPERWAATQNALAAAYYARIQGERAENIELAIHHYTQALEVRTRQADPELWAATQNNLALAYSDRIRGERAENIELAIHHYTQVLEVRTRRAFPADWAATQNNLALAYYARIRGEWAENIELAIHHFNQALEVYTRQVDSERWAMTQNNLANAYRNRIRGERAENVDLAIHHYTQTLEVCTRQAFPADWAMIQNNLAAAYSDRIRGEWAENIELAIHHCTQALEVYTRRAFPADWAMTQNNLANAYRNRIQGERAENIERAIHHFNQALEVYTRQAFPTDWTMTQNNLAAAYRNRIRGERAENIERAIHHYTQALEVRTRRAFPADWAMTQNNLANAYRNRIRGEWAENIERAIHHYTQALKVYTRRAFPTDWAMTQNNLAAAYSDRIQGDRAKNIERAIHHYTQALKVYTRQTDPERWAATQNNLALAYYDRIQGERAENVEQAIHHFRQASTEYTPEVWPERARDVTRRLGTAHFAARHWPAAHTAFAQARALTDMFYLAALLQEVQHQEAGANACMYTQDAFCLAQLHDLPAAWAALEAGRARALRQGLDRVRARRALANAPPTVQERHRSLAIQEQTLRAAMQLPQDDPHHLPYHQARDEWAALVKERRTLEAALLTAARAEIETGAPTLEAVGQSPWLQDGRTALLSLAATEHGTLALLLTGRGLQHTVVPGLTETQLRVLIQGPDAAPAWGGWLGAYLSQFWALREYRRAAIEAALTPSSTRHRHALEDARKAWQAAHDRWRDTLAQTLDTLSEKLWSALDEMLQAAGVARVVLVPQGLLFLLPLHACSLNSQGGELVGEHYTVAYAPAGSVLVRLAAEESTAAASQALVVVNPTGDLRYTPSEALAVTLALQEAEATDRVTTLWEKEASQEKVVEAVRDAGLVHYSGHGRYDWLAPERSGLLLRDPRFERVDLATEEGIDTLTVAEMGEQLHLFNARLVTLSACETGLAEFRHGLADEYIGLPGILLQAGARAVVASLWAVDDLATALLMRQFYVEWQRGAVPVAQALGQAQVWLRTRSRAQVEAALAELDAMWEPWRGQHDDPAMQRCAREQYWVILETRERLEEMPDPPFAHPYWWAAFQAVGDVL